MKTPRYTLTCTRNEKIANDIYEFAFTKPEGFTFVPGQFILFDVAAIENPEDIQTRAMSIASSPDEEELLFVAKMIEGGRASRWIAEKLQTGDEVSIQGPFGLFTIKEKEKDLVLVATSTGVAPFRSQVRSLLKEGDTRRIDLIYGVRSEEDLFWHEELKEMSKKSNNFFVHFALSQASESWTGHKGRVQTLVPLIEKDLSKKSVYICGNPEMTKEMKSLCLDEWGIEKSNLHIEGYI